MWLLDAIKRFEGEHLQAYKDPIGIPTIGVGLTRIHGRSVRLSDTITAEESTQFLEEEVQDFLEYVIEYSETKGYNWNSNQIGALTSFAFNLGKGSIKQLTADGKRNNKTIANKMLLYVKAGGKTLPGLVKRRKEESEHFKL